MTVLLVALGFYAAAVLGLGALARRGSTGSPEEYFLAGRGLGTAVLFFALFGTNCTAFVLVGIPGRAYHEGFGTFTANAPIVALGVPLTFLAIGLPARRLAAELGALTPAELYAKRLDSRAVGWLLFGVYALYTVPYMVTAVQGAAVTLASTTGGAVPEWAGGAAVLALALAYTSLGGMRATAWTNCLQGALFLGFVVVAFVAIADTVGGGAGVGGAFRRVAEERPELLVPGDGGLFEPRAFASWNLAIALTVIAFPHMLVRLMAADSERTLKRVVTLYPLALVLLWVPAVCLGVLGAVDVPGLEGRESDRVLALLTGRHLAPAMGTFAFLAVLAAVMSTLDAQILTLGSMLTRDVLEPALPNRGARADVLRGRLFGLAVAIAVFALWQLSGTSIFRLASVSFSGYVTLVPTLLLGVRWRRFDAAGAVASLLVGNAVYVAALHAAGGLDGALRPAWLGFLPVFWGLLAASLAAVLVPLRPRARDAGIAVG